MNTRNRQLTAIFDRSARAVRTTLAKGVSTRMQVENMKKGRLTLLLFIRDLATSKPKFAAHIERALHDLHPHTDYCNFMMIRDVADVCVTLNRLEHGRRRSNRETLLDSALLCEYLKDEFAQEAQNQHVDAT